MARLAFYAAMTGLAEALAAAAPPEKPIATDWPDAIIIDQGLVGGGRLAWSDGCAEDTAPDWLVFAAMIRTIAVPRSADAAYPTATALAEEGFEDWGAEGLVERFARHLMVMLDRWQDMGFASIVRPYSARLPTGYKMADNGDLLVPERRSLRAALTAPSWLDAANGSPALDWRREQR